VVEHFFLSLSPSTAKNNFKILWKSTRRALSTPHFLRPLPSPLRSDPAVSSVCRWEGRGRGTGTPDRHCTLSLIVDNACKVDDAELGLMAVLGGHIVGVDLVLGVQFM
jgi:hypothetical protein